MFYQYSVSLAVLTVFFLCSNCSAPTEAPHSSINKHSKNASLEFNITPSVHHPNIRILSSTVFDSLYKGSDGLLISITALVEPEVFATIPAPYKALWADLIYSGDTLFSCRTYDYPEFEKTTFYRSTPNLIQQSDTLQLQFHLPYRKLSSSLQGPSNIEFEVGFFPLAFTSDPNRTESKICSKPSDKAVALFTYKVAMQQPTMHAIQVSLQDIQLDPNGKKISSYDVAMGGKGLPDIYWQLWCGNELLFYSPKLKNVESYTNRINAPSFQLTDKDIVEIHILDYDNGPFNQDDEIYSWKGTYRELNKLRVLQSNKLKGANVLMK